jgi:hypothetical protein
MMGYTTFDAIVESTEQSIRTGVIEIHIEVEVRA